MPSPRRSAAPGFYHFRPTIQPKGVEIDALDLSRMDEDPMTYFLTPENEADMMDFDMDFDAGIEDGKHPSEIVRNVSPSNLEGFSRPPPRPPTPPRSPGTPELEYDLSSPPNSLDDGFLQAAARTHFGMPPLSLREFTAERTKSSRVSGGSSRGRSMTSAGGSDRKMRRVTASSRLSPHAWREPSPDVWSIEEKPEEERIQEEEYDSEMMDSTVTDVEAAVVMRARAVDIPAKKSHKKRVRFVLPGVTDMH
ncbi:hypothetical protein QBC42DRAFT_280058 [Cladorrhinum samala]|uniref:Uncharacterized protein n=1 Tax=Cladorrhinum samala TaxID=585594 RepID=A0AAV9H8B7_9PEZI|nr:hypothetical protein QBC42DRAFT_280058 [Cladorrhinum samala]